MNKKTTTKFKPDAENLLQELLKEYSQKKISSEEKLSQLRETDITWKIKARPNSWRIFIWLLIIQNFIVYVLVIIAFFIGKLEDLSLILGVLLTGTLAETAYLVRIIVSWVFSDIDYRNSNTNIDSSPKK